MSDSYTRSAVLTNVLPLVGAPRIRKSPSAPERTRAEVRDKAKATKAECILRFRQEEIATHWSIAIPFMACYATGLILKLFFDLRAETLRDVLSWTHRVGGASLIFFPLFNAWRHRSRIATHIENIKRAWIWTADDIKWLLLFGAAAVSRKVRLPEQHKFNAAEKLNFMMVMVTYPLFAVTGLILCIPGVHFLTWLAHLGLALAMTPLVLGHVYMAVVNPATRKGISGMLSGHVDREWAKHHYGRWYREHFEPEVKAEVVCEERASALGVPALISCPSCSAERPVDSLLRVIEGGPDSKLFACLACGATADRASVRLEPEQADAFMRELEDAGYFGLLVEPFPAGDGEAAVAAIEDDYISAYVVASRSLDASGQSSTST
jgi:formate dehydrogenase subunit gamma